MVIATDCVCKAGTITPVRGTFNVRSKLAGPPDVDRTAATTVNLFELRQLCGDCSMI